MMRAFIAAISLVLFAAYAVANEVVDSPEADKTYLTIYPQNLAMISEVRRVNVPAGKSTIRFLGVSDEIIAQTAVLQSFEGLSLESNFDSDLITKGALLNKATGKDITIRRINPGNGDVELITGRIVSASNINNVIQGAILETSDGIEALECSGLGEAVLFSGMPTALNPAPVLSMEVQAEQAGEKEITLSYLSQGISWQADYRLDVSDDREGEGALTGWLTISNNTAKSFKDVPTAIIAGRLNRDYNTRSDYVPQKRFSPYCWPKGSTKTGIPAGYSLYSVSRNGFKEMRSVQYAAAPQPLMMEAEAGYADDEIVVTASKRQATQEDFGDYKLYRTPNPITIAAMQTKQIAFLDVKDAVYEQVYKFDLSPRYMDYHVPNQQPVRASVEYEIDNSKEGNLAKPLPRGTFRIMTERENGLVAYLGENQIKDLAVDLPVEVRVSESASVLMLPNVRFGAHNNEFGLQIGADIYNASPDTKLVEMTLTESSLSFDNIDDSSHEAMADEIRPTYRFHVNAEDSERFYLHLSGQTSFFFDYEDLSYDADEVGDTDRIFAEGRFKLNSDGWADWISEFADDYENEDVTLKAELIKLEEIDGSDDHYLVTERFVFKNDTAADAEVFFELPSAEYFYKLLDTSIAPSSTDPFMWKITVPANDQKTLTIEAETDYF